MKNFLANLLALFISLQSAGLATLDSEEAKAQTEPRAISIDTAISSKEGASSQPQTLPTIIQELKYSEQDFIKKYYELQYTKNISGLKLSAITFCSVMIVDFIFEDWVKSKYIPRRDQESATSYEKRCDEILMYDFWQYPFLHSAYLCIGVIGCSSICLLAYSLANAAYYKYKLKYLENDQQVKTQQTPSLIQQ